MATDLAGLELGRRDPRTAVHFGRYAARGKTFLPNGEVGERLVLVEELVSWIDVETGALEPIVELGAGVWRVLFPGQILSERELVVKPGRTVRFDSIVATP